MTEVTSRPEPPQFDPTVPNVTRMYDCYLGGKDNFAADREAAEMALSVAPEMRVGALEVRKFLTRAVKFLVGAGIQQFVDIGCGLPTQGNVHEVAQGDLSQLQGGLYVRRSPRLAALVHPARVTILR